MTELTVRSYERKHTLWQALAEGSSITVFKNIDKSITIGLNSNGYRLATERVYFKTFKARDAAMDYAAEKGAFRVFAGTTRHVEFSWCRN